MLEDEKRALPDEQVPGSAGFYLASPLPSPDCTDISGANGTKDTEAGASYREAGEGREDNGGLGWHAVSEDLGLYVTPELGISLYMKLRTILTFEETYGSTR